MGNQSVTIKAVLVALSLGLLVSCAKERAYEPVVQEAGRLAKSRFQQGPYIYQSSQVAVNNAGNLVPMGAVGIYLNENDLVNFEITENRLNVVSVDPLYTSAGMVTKRRLASYPIRHVDVVPKQNADGKNTHEEEVTTERRPWQERAYMEIDFTQDSQDVLGTENVAITTPPLQVEFDDKVGAINYTIDKELRDGSQVSVHHSFLKFAPSATYQQKEYSKFAQTRFGIFKTETYKMNEYGQILTKDLKEFMNRWDSTKPIVYYFSGNYPEHLKGPTRDVFANWNKAWKAATGKALLEIRENTGQKLGDLRYSFIHYDDDMSGGRLLGYGPSVTNPRTGEILKGDVFLYGGTLKSAIRSTRLWAEAFEEKAARDKEKTEKLKTSATFHTDSPAVAALTQGPLMGWQELGLTGMNNSVAIQALKSNLGRDEKILSHFYVEGTNGKRSFRTVDIMKEARLAMVGDTSKKGPEHTCNTQKLDEFRLGSIREAVLVKDLSDEELEIEIFMPLLAHEMGHNFGLRHNFMGSADKKHFAGEVKSGSVMDYAYAPQEAHGPAGYDTAALTAAYSDDPKALEEFQKKNYYFCTDHQAMSSRNMLCGLHDAGTTLSEVTKTLKKRYDLNYAIFNKRDGRAFFSNNQSEYLQRIAMFIVPLRFMYDHSTAVVKAAAEGPSGISELWSLLQQRIEADPESTRTVPLKLPEGGQVILDAEKLSAAIKDAGQARGEAFQALVEIMSGRDAEGNEKSDYDEADLVYDELETKGVLIDKILALLMIGSQTPHPITGQAMSLYEDLDKPMAEVFKLILSNSVDGEDGPNLVFSNPNLRYIATDILGTELGRPGQLTAESIEMLRLTPNDGSQATKDAVEKVRKLREEFRLILGIQQEDQIQLVRLALDAQEINTLLETSPPAPIADQLKVQLKEIEGKVKALNQAIEKQGEEDKKALKRIFEERNKINLASIQVGHRSFTSPLNMAEFELGLNMDTATGALIKNNVNFMEDVWLAAKDVMDGSLKAELEKAEKLASEYPEDPSKAASLQTLRQLSGNMEERLTLLRRYVQMEKQFVGSLYKIYDPAAGF